MRFLLAALALLAPVALAGCGHEERTVVVSPPPGSAVVVPPSGQPHVCPSGEPTC